MKHFKIKSHIEMGRLCPIILFEWFLVALIVPNLILAVTEKLSFFAASTNVLLPLGFYWLAMSLSKNPGKAVLWLFPFAFLGAFELVLLQLYGRSVIAVDMFLNLVTTNPGEAGELLGNLVPILCVVVILYLVPIVMAFISLKKRWQLTQKFQRMQRWSSSIVLGLGVLSFLLACFASGAKPYKPGVDLFPVNAINNAIIATSRFDDSKNYRATSKNFKFNASTEFDDSTRITIVMVIGETGRADNWQLEGYDRPTNSALQGFDNLIFFPKALSESNTTHKSVPMLMSHLTADNFNDSINVVKSIITAFNEAGFETSFLTSQHRNHSYIDYFGEEANNCVFLFDSADSTTQAATDFMLMPLFADALKGDARKKFIVLHTYGSHFNYGDRYVDADRLFTPDSPLEASKGSRRELVNAYDNTIVSTSRFLAQVIDQLKEIDEPSAMVYTSDHGEDIFDDYRNLFLHASPVPSYHQIHVPMLVWMSDGYVSLNPGAFNAARTNMTRNVSSSASMFHTVSDLAKLNMPLFSPSSSVVSPLYVEPKRRYLNDLNESVTLRDAKLDDVDFEEMTRRGIDFGE